VTRLFRVAITTSIWDLELREYYLQHDIRKAEQAAEELPDLKKELARVQEELRKRQEEDPQFRDGGEMAEVAQVS